jgi:CO/xanthine dehydrogenase FAD-binding subunit
VRDHDAEMGATTRLDWDRAGAPHPSVAEGFARRMAAASRPIDDHRATAAYRRHAVEVMARRALERAWRAA